MFSNSIAYKKGKRAYASGIKREHNPYLLASKQFHKIFWSKGWDEAEKLSLKSKSK